MGQPALTALIVHDLRPRLEFLLLLVQEFLEYHFLEENVLSFLLHEDLRLLVGLPNRKEGEPVI